MDWLVYLVEGLFLVLFLATLWTWYRQRDPVSRDLSLVFSALAVLFLAEAWELITGVPAGFLGAVGGALSAVGAVLLILQPVFTLHLVSLIRPIPRRLLIGGTVVLLAPIIPALLLRSALGAAGPMTFILVGAFVVLEAIAAIYLLLEAIRRDGPVSYPHPKKCREQRPLFSRSWPASGTSLPS
jgi:hypothetical protein